MSAIGLVNLAERLLNQGNTQGQDLPATQDVADAQATAGGTAASEDQFTPSAQNGQAQATAQDAGIFTVAQFAFFSAAATQLLGQAGTATAADTATTGNPPATQAAGATASASNAPNLPNFLQTFNQIAAQQAAEAPANTSGANANGADAASVGNGGTNPQAANATAAVQTTAAAAGNIGAGANTGGATNANTAAGSPAVQQQLESLNNDLAALGLTPQEIQQLDQIASITNEFNPNAFTALAYQLEELAPTPQAATAANTNTQNAAGNGNAGAAQTNAQGVGGNTWAVQTNAGAKARAVGA